MTPYLPANLQTVWQRDYLSREFLKGLEATFAYAQIADVVPFPNRIGETITSTRAGLYTVDTNPISPTDLVSNLNNGMTPQDWSVEQYSLALAQYGKMGRPVDANTDNQIIASVFQQTTYALGEQAGRTLDTLARNALYVPYNGGNTWVLDTIASPQTTLHVDNIVGFQKVYNPNTATTGSDMFEPVSVSYPLNVTISTTANPAGTVYVCVGAVADATNISSIKSIGGISGTLTFSTNVTVLDGTEGNGLVAETAPYILRADSQISTYHLTGANTLTLKLLRSAITKLRENAVPTVGQLYNVYMDYTSMEQLFDDPEFKSIYGTNPQSYVYSTFRITEIFEARLVASNMAPQQNLNGLNIRRPIVCGAGTLIRGQGTAFLQGDKIQNVPTGSTVLKKYMKTKNGVTVAMTLRPPLDLLGKVYDQAWEWVGGHTVPTDITTNPNTVPTASNSYYKRAVVIETA